MSDREAIKYLNEEHWEDAKNYLKKNEVILEN